MHMKKIIYILTALLIAAIVGLLIWGHGVRSAGRSLIPAGIRRHIRRRSVWRERRGFRKPAACPRCQRIPFGDAAGNVGGRRRSLRTARR